MQNVSYKCLELNGMLSAKYPYHIPVLYFMKRAVVPLIIECVSASYKLTCKEYYISFRRCCIVIDHRVDSCQILLEGYEYWIYLIHYFLNLSVFHETCYQS